MKVHLQSGGHGLVICYGGESKVRPGFPGDQPHELMREESREKYQLDTGQLDNKPKVEVTKMSRGLNGGIKDGFSCWGNPSLGAHVTRLDGLLPVPRRDARFI